MSLFYKPGRPREVLHEPQKVWPTQTDPITLTSGSTSWGFDGFIEVMPAGTIPNKFDVALINVAGESVVDTYEVHLFSGTTGNEELMAMLRVARAKANDSYLTVVTCPIQQAGARLSAKLAHKLNGVATINLSIGYHDIK